MKSKRSKLRLSRIRKHASYSIQDVSELLGVHKNTVMQWLKNGLPKIDEQRPFLIHGQQLKNFLKARQQSRRSSCAPHEFYCFRCRSPQRAMGNLADVALRTEKTIILSGLCASCEAPLNKIQSLKAIPKIIQSLDIPRQQLERLSGALFPSLNCDFKEET